MRRLNAILSAVLIPALLVFLMSPAWSLAQEAAPTASQYAEQRAPDAAQEMTPTPPEDHVDVVRLSDVEGAVRLVDSTGKTLGQAQVNEAVTPGTLVETGNDGRAELEFAEGSVARVTPNSELDLVAMTRDETGHARVTLKAARGLTYYELPQSNTSFVVEVGSLLAMRGSNPDDTGQKALLRVSLDASPFEAAVLRGDIHFEDAAKTVSYDLDANQTARIDPASANNYDTADELTPDTWDAWNADRDSVLAQMTSVHPSGEEGAGPGWSDLDYYGSWYNVPGQGMAWAPDGVDQSFDPYGSGAWSYSAGLGYSWASAYPWGWLPYHCGLWNYYSNYGWMWQPAHCGWGYAGGWYPYSEARGQNGYQLPLRLLPARGITHLTPSQPVIVVRRGAPVRFRNVGEPRPAGRPVVLAGETLQPASVEMRPRYSVGAGRAYPGNFRTSQGNSGARGAFEGSPGIRFIPPPAGSTSSTVIPRSSPPPIQAPRMSAPAAPSAPPASHASAPASSSVPAGHH